MMVMFWWLCPAAALSVHPSVWKALEKCPPGQIRSRALALEDWRVCLGDGLVPESSCCLVDEPLRFAGLARLTKRYPKLVPGALKLVAAAGESSDDGAAAAEETARALGVVEGALGSSVVDALASEAAVVSGKWRPTGISQLEALSRRLESDLAELREVFDALGRARKEEEEEEDVSSIRARFSSDSIVEVFDGYALSGDPVRAAVVDRALRRRKEGLWRAKVAGKLLTGLDPATKSRGTDQAGRGTPGGPILVCLDTSHSMAGSREALSKACVLAATRAALRQRRPVKVMAFSGTHDLAEVDCRVSDAASLARLGRFLEHSFGGGTDIAAPLRRAIAHLREGWRDADVVIVSDGEVAPVDEGTMEALSEEREDRGLRVTGLLAGRARPPADPYKNARPGTPFARLCDGPVRTFLARRDDLSLLLRAAAVVEPDDPLDAALGAAEDRLPPLPESSNFSLDAVVEFAGRGLVDREIEARLVVLGAISREHVLFCGPPGTAKSELCRRLAAVLGGPSFELALTRFTTPDDVFGPLSLAALDRDEYRRARGGIFAQRATAVFFDEIFRAKTVLPALLALLNERKWWDGPELKRAELVTAVAATNSLPDEDDTALYDRFLIRRVVAPVSDDKLPDLLTMEEEEEDVETAATKNPPRLVPELSRADLPAFAVAFLCDARRYLRDTHAEHVSDRRLRRCAEMLRRVAAARGARTVSGLDLLLTRFVLWSNPATHAQVDDWLFDRVVPPVDPAFLPLLEDALAANLDEIDALVDAIADAAVEMRRLLSEFRNATHPLLAPSDLRRARQRLAPLADARLARLLHYLKCAIDLRTARISVSDDLVDTLPADLLSNLGEGGFDDDDDDDDMIVVEEEDVPFDLSWSKKQAKARLTAAEFRDWTAARRRRRSRSSQ